MTIDYKLLTVFLCKMTAGPAQSYKNKIIVKKFAVIKILFIFFKFILTFSFKCVIINTSNKGVI